MKLLCGLFVLVSCTPSLPPVQPAPDPQPAAAIRALPPVSTCPPPVCPRPPQPVHEPEPVAEDWHCIDVRRPGASLESYCFPSSFVCEHERSQAIRDRFGTLGQCETQRLAYCFEVANAKAMHRQIICARTSAVCEQRRPRLVKNRENPDFVSPCRAILNTDPFTDAADIRFRAGP